MHRLEQLSKKGTEFLGCKYPIICGAMAWISESTLVSAVCEAGGFGTIACSSMPPEMLDKEIKATKAKTDKNFGVNLIVMHPQLDELIEICKKNKVSHVVFAGGLPKTKHIKSLHEDGIKVIGFAPALKFAKRLIKSGIDALLIEGTEAGGHIGAVSTSVLAQEVLLEVNEEIPVFVAGGIGRGEMIASYLLMGAAGCQLGTRFIATKEAKAHQNYKSLLLNSNPKDATICNQIDPEFHVIPVRAIKNKGCDEFIAFQQKAIERCKKGEVTKEEAQLEIENFWAGALRKAVVDGDVEMGSVMAGQSVGMVNEIKSVAEIIDELVAQTVEFLE